MGRPSHSKCAAGRRRSRGTGTGCSYFTFLDQPLGGHSTVDGGFCGLYARRARSASRAGHQRPHPVAIGTNVWLSAGRRRMSVFLILLGAFLYSAAPSCCRSWRPRSSPGWRRWSRRPAGAAFRRGLPAWSSSCLGWAHWAWPPPCRRPGQRIDQAGAGDRRHYQGQAGSADRRSRRCANRRPRCSAPAAAPSMSIRRHRASCCRWSPSSRRRPASSCCSLARCCSSWSARWSCALRWFRCSATAIPSCVF